MAGNVAYNALLTNRVGLSQASANAFIAEGYDSMLSLLDLKATTIPDMLKRLIETRRAMLALPQPAPAQGEPAVPPPEMPVFNHRSVTNLTALCNWVAERSRTGEPLDSGLVTDAVLEKAKARVRELENIKLSEENSEVEKPKSIGGTFKNWEARFTQFCTYISTIRGAAGIPLTYVFRDEAEVTPEALAATYDSNDDRLIRCVRHDPTSDYWNIDNRKVWQLYKDFAGDGIAARFWKATKKNMNGRKAVLDCRAQAEGKSFTNNRLDEARNATSRAVFKGPTRNFDWQDYVSIFADNYATLEDLGEPEHESKKVREFIDGIKFAPLATAIAASFTNNELRTSFNKMQLYLTDCYNSQAVAAPRDTRAVAGALTEAGQSGGNGKGNNGGGHGGGGGNNSRKRKFSGKLEARSYTRAEWQSMTKEQRDKVQKLRKASAAITDSNEDEGEETEGKQNAGSQFGRKSYKNNKGKKDNE